MYPTFQVPTFQVPTFQERRRLRLSIGFQIAKA